MKVQHATTAVVTHARENGPTHDFSLNLEGMYPRLVADTLTIEAPVVQLEGIPRIADQLKEAGLSEREIDGLVDDFYESIHTLMLAKVLARRHVR